VLDDATAGADRRTADEMIGHLQSATAEGPAVLVASRDPNLVQAGHDVIELEG
jgi:ABC-type Mn2+/Zn2+ transport system ATPase subunit